MNDGGVQWIYIKNKTISVSDKINEQSEKIRLKINHTRNVVIIIAVIGLLITGVIIALISKPIFIIVPGFIFAFVLVFAFVGSTMSIKNKIVNTLLNQEMMNDYNIENDLHYTYETSVRDKPMFNRDMGLFTRGASISTHYRISGVSNELAFELRNCDLLVSTGNSTVVVFTGYYLVFDMSDEKIFQLRSDGKPSLKKTKFKRLINPDFRSFVLEEDKTGIERKYVTLLSMLQREFGFLRLYVGSNSKEIHLALTPHKGIKLPKEMNNEVFIEYQKQFVKIFEALDRTTNLLRSEKNA